MFGLEKTFDLSEIENVNLYGPWVWYLVAIYLSLPILAYIILPFLMSKGTRGTKPSIAIYVLGDLGHSPRMCYHARSFSNLDYSVNLCGYLESDIALDLMDDANIDIHPIPIIKDTRGLPFILFAMQKITLQIFYLFKLLFELRGSHYIMIQNPPSIPILLVVIVFNKLFSSSKLIIDWHNLNYSILNLRYKNESHILVRVLKLYEKVLAKYADLNLTVTKSMKTFLVEDFGLDAKKIKVLYDRPGQQFSTLENLEFNEEEIKLHEVFNGIDMDNRKVLVSSTSFTPDEDFNILLDALAMYDKSETTIPILLLVTGKGPLKEEFLRRSDSLNFSSKVIVRSAWLAIEDYPLIISVADIGISLHTSSSGLDLPMKILDFFGCGVPVISLNFPSINELVKDKINGLVTHDANNEERSAEILRLIQLFLQDESVATGLKEGARQESTLRWRSNWMNVLGDYFKYR